MIARVFLFFAVVLALSVGALWQPVSPDAIDLTVRHAAPSLGHPLGTDHLGRDMLARVMVGGWRTAAVLVIVGAIGFVGGCVLGTLAALLGGWRETVLLRLAELPIVMPTLVVALAAAALFGLNPLTAGLALGLAGVGPYALLTHALAIRVMTQPYAQAAVALGVSTPALMTRHVLPAIAPVLMAHVGSNAGRSVVAYASLAFLGLGADPSQADWGAMLFEYRLFLFDDPALMIWPCLPIALSVLILNRLFDPEQPDAVEAISPASGPSSRRWTSRSPDSPPRP